MVELENTAAARLGSRLRPGHRWLTPAFMLSIFLSALLLFSVQPMFTKMALPLLGGAPNVWNAAMVFFQATLLAGYVYAHLLSKHAGLSYQIVIHLAVLGVGITFLPLAVAPGWAPPEEGAPALWLIALYAVSIGMPFFALSATAPLLQRWFSYSGHKDARDPYFLYAASNLGSLLALLAYPVVVEPALGVGGQSAVWSAGYGALAVTLLCAGGLAAANQAAPAPDSPLRPAETRLTDAPVPWTRRLLWIALACVPSSLMLGVTNKLSVDIASAPFLWVLPLSLYLLTFVIVFARRPLISSAASLRLLPIVLIALSLLSLLPEIHFLGLLAIHLALFFLIALALHGRLAATRPAAGRLTEFYVCMSVGGVLGGLFNALAAPMIFDGIYEYGLVAALAGLAVGGAWPTFRSLWRDIGLALAFFAALLGLLLGLRLFAGDSVSGGWAAAVVIVFAGAHMLAFIQKQKPVVFGGSLLALFLIMALVIPDLATKAGTQTLFQERSFFGVTRVEKKEQQGRILHKFVHGQTVHNLQIREPGFRDAGVAYYATHGPIGQAIELVRTAKGGPVSIGVIGLGAGALACHAKPGDRMKFYEIDPVIAKMARNPALFSYLRDCAPEAPVVLGDARLKLQKEPADAFDLLVVDAFSSDAIPAHLVTREALALYRSKMRDKGIILFHTSNRYIDVSSVVLGIADDAGLESRLIKTGKGDDPDVSPFVLKAYGVAVGDPATVERVFADQPRWQRETARGGVGVWTDDYSNIFGAIVSGLARAEDARLE